MYTTYVYNSLPSIDARTAGGQGHAQKGGLDEEEQEEKKNHNNNRIRTRQRAACLFVFIT